MRPNKPALSFLPATKHNMPVPVDPDPSQRANSECAFNTNAVIDVSPWLTAASCGWPLPDLILGFPKVAPRDCSNALQHRPRHRCS